MRKYVIQNDLIALLSDDFNAASSSMQNNLEDAIDMFVNRAGLKFIASDSFEFRAHGDVIFCENIGPMLFRDHQIYIPASSESLKVTCTSSSDQYVYIQATRTLSAGVTSTTISLAVDTSPPTSTDTILLWKVQRGVSTWEVEEDFRDGNSLILNDGSADLLAAPTSLSVTSIYQNEILNQQETGIATSGIANTESPHTNLSTSKAFFDISWNSIANDNNVYMYHLSLRPYGVQALNSLGIDEYILGNKGKASYSTLVEVVEGVKYSVRVRGINKTATKLPGAWSEEVVLIAGSDLVETTIPAPTLVSSVTYEPTIVSLDVSIPDPTPAPSFVQVFKHRPTDNNQADSVELIYEGSPCNVKHVILKDEDGIQFSARTVGPGGICSSYTELTDEYSGTSHNATFGPYSAEPGQKIITIPIELNDTSGIGVGAHGEIFLRSIRPPSPGGKITRMEFLSRGSVAIEAAQAPSLQMLNICLSTSMTDPTSVYLDISSIFTCRLADIATLVSTVSNYHKMYSDTYTASPFWEDDLDLVCFVYYENGAVAIDTLNVVGTLVLYVDMEP